MMNYIDARRLRADAMTVIRSLYMDAEGRQWRLLGAGFLDGMYSDIWTARRALREVWHG